MIEDGGADEEYPLPNVKSAILVKVIEYMKYHKDHVPEQITKPLRSANLAENNICEWDAEFINVPNEILFEIILAANYMDIRPLLELGSAKTASMIRGKTVEQIRQEFNIVNDFTEEEEARIREENKWCEDA